ncbi:MAG: GGDEF domain-containing protein [Treponema sp.]|jgi:diguanylate cyclase (GGDEF)-like protein|nr:GGDEF domain-containing protein [Treponema sp.]
MSLPYALNTFFGPALIIILIFAECIIKYSSDKNIKLIFITFLTITFFSMTVDFILSTFNIFNFIILKENIIHIIINYLPVFFALCILIYIRKIIKQNDFLIILLLSLFLSSLTVNTLTGSVKLIWAIMAALLLYAYLFIVLKENKIDSLTGLDNRYSFYEFTGRLSRSRSGESWAIAILDIDNFKSINSVYGNLEGDSALQNLAQIIKTCIRKTDFAARYGGDEFVIVAKATANISELTTNIKEELDKHNKKGEKPYDIEISCEFDTYTTDGSISINKFLKNIDELMYKRNKESRRAGDLEA